MPPGGFQGFPQIAEELQSQYSKTRGEDYGQTELPVHKDFNGRSFQRLIDGGASGRRRGDVGMKVLAGWALIVLVEVLFFYLIFSRLLHVPLPEGFFF